MNIFYENCENDLLTIYVIRIEVTGIRIFVDDNEFVLFRHRMAPESVNGLYVSGRVKLFKIIYNSPSVNIVI